MLELLMDPAVWVGLATLIVLEIVLGIDNLIFIAILADKLPPHQRDRARIIGLSLALFMRLGLLSIISWLVTLTVPLFSVFGQPFSGRDLILLLGGLFLIYKATTELHERLEGTVAHKEGGSRVYAGFAVVVTQIVILDAVFSLDSVITAVGMVDQLPVMMAAVVISIIVMLFASKSLTLFVNAHPTVVVLCLSFLLMVGLALVVEGLGFHLPKSYLYAAIGFSIMIEALNQVAKRNMVKHEARRPLRERTAETVLKMLGGQTNDASHDTASNIENGVETQQAFAPVERHMVSGVLTLADRDVRSIMTSRSDISWINIDDDANVVREKLLDAPHAIFPVCNNSLDDVIGVARAKDLLGDLMKLGHIDQANSVRSPIYVHETTKVIKLIEILRHARGQIVLVSDEYGLLKGIVSPIDILEAIAGEFPDEDETLEIQEIGSNQWLAAGNADLHQLELLLPTQGLVSEAGEYTLLAGFLLAKFARVPEEGETFIHQDVVFTIAKVENQRIAAVSITKAETDQAS